MINPVLASAVVAIGFGLTSDTALASDCGKVTIAEMNWASAGVAAQVDKIILEAAYGCSVETVAGDTVPTFISMNEKAEPDMAPEFWVNGVHPILDAALKEGRLIETAEILQDGAVEGWWIPKFIADAHPDIKTVDDALKHPELFSTPNSARAAIHNCPADWSCHISTANLYRATGAQDKGFDLVGTDNAVDLDASIASAFENKTGWLGYYWAPTPIMGKYEMIKLSFGVPHSKTEWDTCTSLPECPGPQINSYPESQAFTLVTEAFAEKAAVAMDYVNARKWSNATVSSILAWQTDNQANNRDAARYFLREHEDVWRIWLSPDAADKVKSAL